MGAPNGIGDLPDLPGEAAFGRRTSGGGSASRLPAGAEIWNAVVDWLTKNVPQAVVFAGLGAAFGIVSSAALHLFFPGSALDPFATQEPITPGIGWTLASTVLFAVIGYWWSVGTERFLEALAQFPASIANLFSAGGGSAHVHLLWGAGLAMLVSLVVSPAIGGAVAIALVVGLPSLLGGVLSNLLFRLWSTLVALVSPTRRHPLDGAIMMAVGLMGSVVALGAGWLIAGTVVKLVIAAACVGLALSMAGRRGVVGSYLLPFLWAAAISVPALLSTTSAQLSDASLTPEQRMAEHTVGQKLFAELDAILSKYGNIPPKSHGWLTDLLYSVEGYGGSNDSAGPEARSRFAHVFLYRFRYLTLNEVPAGRGADTRELLPNFWNQNMATAAGLDAWLPGGTDIMQEQPWVPPGERGVAYLESSRFNDWPPRIHRAFQRNRWIVHVAGEPGTVDAVLPEIVDLIDRIDADLNQAYSDALAGRIALPQSGTTTDGWRRALEELLGGGGIIAVGLGLTCGLGGTIGGGLGSALANLSAGRGRWWEGAPDSADELSDLPEEGDGSASETRGGGGASWDPETAEALDDLPTDPVDLPPSDPSELIGEPPDTEDRSELRRAPEPVDLSEPTSDTMKAAGPGPTAETLSDLPPQPAPEPTELPDPDGEAEADKEKEEPGFWDRFGDRLSKAIGSTAEEMSNAWTDVVRDPSILMYTARGIDRDVSGAIADTAYNVGLASLRAKNAAIEAAGDVWNDKWIVADTLGGTVESMGKGLLAAGEAATDLASGMAQAYQDLKKDWDLFGDTLLGMSETIAAGAQAIRDAVTNPDTVFDFLKTITGIENFENSLDPNRSLLNRLGQTALGVVNAAGVIFGARAAGEAAVEGGGALVRRLTAEAVDEDFHADYLRFLQRRAGSEASPHSSIRPGSMDDFVPAEGKVPDIRGYREASNRQIQMIADTHGVKIYTRPTTAAAKELLDNRHALPKPELIKNKSLNGIDMDLDGVAKTWTTPDGQTISTNGLVGHFEPRLPSRAELGNISDADYATLADRAAQRNKEFNAQKNWLATHSDVVRVDNGIIVDRKSGMPFTGDVDLFAVRGIHNEPLPMAVVQRVERDLVKVSNGGIQTPADVMHGFHTEWNYRALDRLPHGDEPSKFFVARSIDQTIRRSHSPPGEFFGFDVDVLGGAKGPGGIPAGSVTEIRGGGEALVTYTGRPMAPYTGNPATNAPNPTASYWRGGMGNPLIDEPVGSVIETPW